MSASSFDAVTVTPNPAIDRTVEIANFAPGAVNRAEPLRAAAGGKGVNVAATLAGKGFRIAATGFLGRENAVIFEALFAAKPVADRFVRIAGETRIGIKIDDPAARQTTDINFPGATPSASDLAALRRAVEALDAPWFILAGSLPPGVDPGFYRELAAALKNRGCGVIVDTGGEPLRLAIEAAPAVIKPNIHELEALLGQPLRDEAAVVRAAQALLERGPRLVVVSMGGAGACFVTAGGAVIARPPRVEVRSTVGAGDAMVAGIAAARLRGLPLEECARLATAFSVEALTRASGYAGVPLDASEALGGVTLTPV